MDDKEQKEVISGKEGQQEEQPQVYAVKKDLDGWQFDRRKFLTAAGATAAAAAVGSVSSGCGGPEPVVVEVT
ncbi:MAG: twin-arginine translocation signal domain-containing protein, partial [Anaerolineae bacterium]